MCRYAVLCHPFQGVVASALFAEKFAHLRFHPTRFFTFSFLRSRIRPLSSGIMRRLEQCYR